MASTSRSESLDAIFGLAPHGVVAKEPLAMMLDRSFVLVNP
ncbi:hypothetical protein X727_19385 [Mesorhizobium sp. L103C119B0]|nr:hypothetical protein X736_28510 [Mesorhizobium sp. L2C089B000]ESZ68945.1 hypothetical protein X727_19385 [Mesorhizobium sp. L103C119B0]